jgi:hypothetical protein
LWQPPDDQPSSHSAQLALLLDALQKGHEPPLRGSQARQALEFITGLYASAFTGRPVLRGDLTLENPFYHRLNGGHVL